MKAYLYEVGLSLVVACITPGQAQNDTVAHPVSGSLVVQDGLLALSSAGSVLSAPSRWQGSDWWTVGGIIFATGTVSLADEKANDLMDRNSSSANDQLQKVFVEYGSFWNALLLSGGMYATGLIAKDDWLRETAVLMGTTLLLTSALSSVGKMTVGRARPYTGFKHYRFRPFCMDDDYTSLPSGHAVVAFSISAVLAERIKNPWASAGLYGVAGMCALSRVYSHNHWLSDVFFSGVLATTIARSVVHLKETENGESPETQHLQILPCVGYISVIWKL